MTSPVANSNDASAASHTTGANISWHVIAVVWALVIFTFNMPDREDGAMVLDLVSTLKAATRASSLGLLLMLLWLQWRPTCGRLLVQCLLPLGCFAAWGVLSTVWSPLQGVTVGQIASLIVLLLLTVNIALAWRSEACTSRLFFHLSAVLLFLNSLMLLSMVALGEGSSVARSEDSFIHATMAGSSASVGFLVLLGARLVWGWQWSRLLFLPGMAVHGCLLYLAHSRTAVGATLLTAALIYIVFVNRHAIWACLFAACTLAGLYLVLDPGMDLADSVMSTGSKYVQRDEHASLSSLSGREEMWAEMWKSFQESPWVGHGYFVSSASGELLVWGDYGNWTAHNLILQSLVTTGVIGTLMFVWGLGRPARVLLATMAMDQRHKQLALYLLVASSWFVVWGLTNESILGPLQPECVVFFSMLGLGVGSAVSAVAKTQHAAPISSPVHASVGQPFHLAGVDQT